MSAFIIILVTLATLMASTPRVDAVEASASALLIRVDQSGNGDHKKIQDAIDAVPSNNKELVFILVKPGIYEEKIVVPADKPFITLSGTKANHTIITGNDSGNIIQSATFTVLASDFVARYLTIQNTFCVHGVQAVALRVTGDRAAFFGCRILGYQDTLLDESGRHYYKNCYIEGAVDFICGNSASLFERCHLHTVSEELSAITAQRRGSPSEETGFTFLGCKITGERTAILGRPWGPYSRVIFAFTYMSNVILPRGWDDWGNSSNQRTVFYREYKCYGPGANAGQRVEWSKMLTTNEAGIFLTKNMIGGKSWITSNPKTFKKATISNNSTRHS